MYGNPYIPTMPNVPQPFGYSPQNGLYNQPNNFTPNQFGQPQTGTQPQTSAGITVGQVATIEQVEQVQLMPGEKKIILVQNAPIMAIRIADQMGLVQTEYRKLEAFDPRQAQPAQTEYAPLSEVEQLKTQMNQLYNELKEIKGGASNGKPFKQPVPGGNVSAGTTSEQSR